MAKTAGWAVLIYLVKETFLGSSRMSSEVLVGREKSRTRPVIDDSGLKHEKLETAMIT